MTESFVKSFVGELRREIADKEHELPDVNLLNIYQAGIMQGEIRGLKTALAILDRVIEETDQ